jgi:hypothetical protein
MNVYRTDREERMNVYRTDSVCGCSLLQGWIMTAWRLAVSLVFAAGPEPTGEAAEGVA